MRVLGYVVFMLFMLSGAVFAGYLVSVGIHMPPASPQTNISAATALGSVGLVVCGLGLCYICCYAIDHGSK
jgi:hypothetical protein